MISIGALMTFTSIHMGLMRFIAHERLGVLINIQDHLPFLSKLTQMCGSVLIAQTATLSYLTTLFCTLVTYPVVAYSVSVP